MIGLQEKIRLITEDKAKLRKHLIVGGTLLGLVIALCIFIALYVNMHIQYSSYRSDMQETIYSNMREMIELYDGRNDPETSLQRVIIPDMRALYKTAVKYNELLTKQFKSPSSLLTEDRIAAFDNAFREFITAYKAGTTTGLAEADMAACIQLVRPEVEFHYRPKTTTEPPVTITYGENQN